MFADRDPNRVPAAPAVKIPTLGSPSDGVAVPATATSTVAAVRSALAAYTPSTSFKRRAPVTRSTAPTGGEATSLMARLEVHECGTSYGGAEDAEQYKETPHAWREGPLDSFQRAPREAVGDSPVDRAKLSHERVHQLEGTRERRLPDAPQERPGLPTPVWVETESVRRSPPPMDPAALMAHGATGELLLQKEEFLERLVQRVRASCAELTQEHRRTSPPARAAAAHRSGGAQRLSPPPRRPSSPLAVADEHLEADGESGERGRRCRSRGRSRSRSPSPVSATATSQSRDAAHVQGADSGYVRRSWSSSPSPDPRPPATDLYAPGGALHSSLQHSRCSGVSRGRRSVSAERVGDAAVGTSSPEPGSARVGNAVVELSDHAERSGQPPPRRDASAPSTPRSVSASHPQWSPHPVQEPRPAWNQRQPPRRQRPVVSVPGSQRGASRSPARVASDAHPRSAAVADERRARAGPQCSAERALRRTASCGSAPRGVEAAPRSTPSSSPAAVPPQSTPSSAASSLRRFTSNTPLASAASASPAARREAAGAAATGLATAAGAAPATANTAVTSLASPPSARVLFLSHDADSVAASHSPIDGSASATPSPQSAHMAALTPCAEAPTTASMTTTTTTGSSAVLAAHLQRQCDAALARAARAERQYEVLTHALEQLLVERAADKAAWEARQTALELKLGKVSAWIANIDAEADVQPPADAPTARAAASTTVPEVLDGASSASTDVSALATRTTAQQVPAAGDEKTWQGPLAGKSSVADDSGQHSAEASPSPCVPGATPTPARRICSGGSSTAATAAQDSAGGSTGQVRLPPSPPLVLRMYGATA